MIRGSMKGFVVVNDRGRIEAGTLAYSAAAAKQCITELYDAAEPYSDWAYWKKNGFAAVRCEVVAAANHKKRRAPRS